MKQGSAALTTVIIISFLLLIGGVTLILSNIDLAVSTSDFTNKIQAEIQSQTCLEEAMRKVKSLVAFTGSVNATFSQGNCTAQVFDFSPGIKQIDISSTIGSYTYNLTRRIDVSTEEFVIVF